MNAGHGARRCRVYGCVAVWHTPLIEVLSRHRGETNAVTVDDLAVVLGCRERDNRSLRDAIDELSEDGQPIGSTSRDGAGGYFIIQTEADLQSMEALPALQPPSEDAEAP